MSGPQSSFYCHLSLEAPFFFQICTETHRTELNLGCLPLLRNASISMVVESAGEHTVKFEDRALMDEIVRMIKGNSSKPVWVSVIMQPAGFPLRTALFDLKNMRKKTELQPPCGCAGKHSACGKAICLKCCGAFDMLTLTCVVSVMDVWPQLHSSRLLWRRYNTTSKTTVHFTVLVIPLAVMIQTCLCSHSWGCNDLHCVYSQWGLIM